MKKHTIRYLLFSIFYIAIFTMLINNSLGYLDADFGWHLKTGEEISINKEVPELNTHNFTLYNQEWVDHEWLSNLLIYFIFDKYGYLSLTVIFAVLILITLWIQLYLIKKFFLDDSSFRNDLLIMVFQFLGITAMFPHLGIRVQEITILALQILFLLLVAFDKSRKKIILFVIVPLFWLWASLHGGFLIGFFVFFLWITAKAIGLLLSTKIKPNEHTFFKNIPNFKELILPSIIFVSAFLVTFLTPYGYKLYSLLFGYKDTFYLMHIAEWLPAYYLPIIYSQWAYITLAVFSVLIVAMNLWIEQTSMIAKDRQKHHRFSLWFILLFCSFILLAIKSKRHFPLFFILTSPFIIRSFSDELNNILSAFKKKSLVAAKYAFIVIFLIILTVLSINNIKNFDKIKADDPFGGYCHRYPCQAIESMKNNDKLKDLRLFNYYGWGGYMIWAWPEKQLFIDGRLPQFQFNGHSILEEYYEFFQKEKALSKLDQFSIDMVMVNNKTDKFSLNWFEKYILAFNEDEINSQINELKENLISSEDWTEVYKDDVCSVFARKSAL